MPKVLRRLSGCGLAPITPHPLPCVEMLKPLPLHDRDEGDANYSANSRGCAEFCVALDVVHGWGLSSGCVGLTKATRICV